MVANLAGRFFTIEDMKRMGITDVNNAIEKNGNFLPANNPYNDTEIVRLANHCFVLRESHYSHMLSFVKTQT